MGGGERGVRLDDGGEVAAVGDVRSEITIIFNRE